MESTAIEAVSLGGQAAVGMSVWHLFIRSDIVVKVVMIVLLAASLWSWAIIFDKIRRIRRVEADANEFEDAFWAPSLGTYALAIDGRKARCEVVSSNPGHVLLMGLPSEDRARQVADTLLAPENFSGWGIRTLSMNESCYNPMSYHNGSIWPHDNALIALGLARYGFKRSVERVFKGLFEAATYMEMRRLPELFCGFQRGPGRGPTLYPVACAPQAWAAATPLSLVQACLGLDFDSKARTVRLDRPVLPGFLDEIVLRNLTIDECRLDLAVRRAGSEVATHVLRRTGDVRVEITA